jgi:hypothetical protein
MKRTQEMPPREGQELVLYWTASPSTRCVLVTARKTVDLQLLCGGVVERRTENVDPRVARDIARQWQMEYDIARSRSSTPISVCSECGDEAPVIYTSNRGIERRLCQSCGHEWIAGTTGR